MEEFPLLWFGDAIFTFILRMVCVFRCYDGIEEFEERQDFKKGFSRREGGSDWISLHLRSSLGDGLPGRRPETTGH
jgi:hypothetical protein